MAFAATAGLCFGAATGLINYTLSTYFTPISKLAPIWSCNVLVTLAIGALFLRESAEVNLLKLVTGALLIAAGAVLVGAS